MAQKLMFICGAARSGTSALTELLNFHPEIAVGVERYKNRIMRIIKPDEINELFTKERFFDFKQEDTSVKLFGGKYDALYKAMIEKYDGVTYVGDKVPSLYRRYKRIETFAPGAPVIHIVRDPMEVANSWNGRAERGGGWPEKNDHTRAVEEWNIALQMTRDALGSDKLKLGVVRYDHIFKTGDPSAERLIEWLGLSMTPQFAEGLETTRARANKLSSERKIPDDVRDYVNERADWTAYNALCEIAI